jgi:DNA polymerase III subunit alpha
LSPHGHLVDLLRYGGGMSHADFVHLRTHSAFSLSEGAIHLKALAKLAAAEAMPAVAVTDTANLFGALEFSLAAADAGVQPVIGTLLPMLEPSGTRTSFLPVYAQTDAGYRNLLHLVSKAFLESGNAGEPRLQWDDLEGYSSDLIALTGGASGPLGRLVLAGQQPAAVDLLARLESLFPGRLYVELQRHDLADEFATEPVFLDWAYERDLPLVATNDVYFAERKLHEAHDVLLCIAEGKRLDEPERRRVTPEHYFRSAAAMRELFADLPEAIANTLVIAQRCAAMPLPHKPILPAFNTGEANDEPAELKAQAEEGLEGRLESHVFTPTQSPEERQEVAAPYRERLAYELQIITQMGFPGYFLIVSEFIKWAKGRGIPVGPGRGSGAGSLVAYALQITDLDPLKWGLLFERFLNPERISMPDFDIDFCQDRRDEVIDHVRRRYGEERVAQIITFGKLQARAALRDVGRVLGMPYGQVDKICKLVPNNPANPVTLQQAVDGEPLLQELRRTDEEVGRLIDIALQLEGLYRHASTHAAGVVIGDRPLEQLVPLYRDPRSEMRVTQFNMKWVETAGLVKFDFLGLKTLTVLQQAVRLIAQRGIEIDLLKLPLDDVKTFQLLGSGETAGVFQLEGSGMRDMLRRLKPTEFEDIIAVVSLYRPGPMENIPSYIARKHGREKPDYLHPLLEPVLSETYGIIIYQEQVMQIAQILAGYTLGGADLLRRAMGKKIKEEMAKQRETFVSGAVERGVDERKASEIFDLVDKFAGYGFNKSHAAAYALIAYQTAYLKANYPVEFMAALMTLDMGNTDKLAQFKRDLDRLKIELLPPDVNFSGVKFTVEKVPATDGQSPLAIRYALGAIKNLGRPVCEAVVRERERAGRFADLFAFTSRVDPRSLNRRAMEQLVQAGAVTSLFGDRARAFAAIDLALRHGQLLQEEAASAQVNLFGDATDSQPSPQLPDAQPWSLLEVLERERQAIGFYLSAHPLDDYADLLKRLRVTRISALNEQATRYGGALKIAGVILGRQERRNARGNRFAFLQLSDVTGMVEVTMFSEVLAQSRDVLDSGHPVLMTVDTRIDGETLKITVQSVSDLQEVAKNQVEALRVFVADPTPLSSIQQLVASESGGRGQISIVLNVDPSCEVEVDLPGRYAVTPRFASMLKSVRGVVEVQQIAKHTGHGLLH